MGAESEVESQQCPHISKHLHGLAGNSLSYADSAMTLLKDLAVLLTRDAKGMLVPVQS